MAEKATVMNEVSGKWQASGAIEHVPVLNLTLLTGDA